MHLFISTHVESDFSNIKVNSDKGIQSWAASEASGYIVLISF